MVQEVSLELLHVAMNMAQAKHKVAANNIAMANIKGAEKTSIDFQSVITALKNTQGADREELLAKIKNNWQMVEKKSMSHMNDEIKLDQETAKVLEASGQYKLLADTLNRKLGLMKLSVLGGKR